MIKQLGYALITLSLASVATWASCHVDSETREKRDWPTVPGKVSERGLGPMTGERWSYEARVVYAYEVAGKPYKNDQVYLLPKTGGAPEVMRKIAAEIPDPVPVHYDPADPSHSYLLVNPPHTSWKFLACGIGAYVIGAMQLVVALVRKREPAA